MRKMLILLWAGAAFADNSVPGGWEANCRSLIEKLQSAHPERRSRKPLFSRDHLTFQMFGPEEKAGIYVQVGVDSTGKVEDTPWLDKRGPTPAGKTPEAAFIRHAGNKYALFDIWHTDTTMVPELQSLLDDCMK
jgi:hypothetical protein